MPPQGGDHPTRQAPIGTGQFQSTPPHGRRLHRCVEQDAGFPVSIHASAREATTSPIPPAPKPGVSIHASAREATIQADKSATKALGFNPRLRTGGDPVGDATGVWATIVSIHASAREATGAVGNVDGGPHVSIHASAREATRSRHFPSLRPGCFNPRLRTGGDAPTLEEAKADAVFQSTPPHGRRLGPLQGLFLFQPVSIHASAREATSIFVVDHVDDVGFNPRLRTGGDPV